MSQKNGSSHTIYNPEDSEAFCKQVENMSGVHAEFKESFKNANKTQNER